jgi:hypothetical protein
MNIRDIFYPKAGEPMIAKLPNREMIAGVVKRIYRRKKKWFIDVDLPQGQCITIPASWAVRASEAFSGWLLAETMNSWSFDDAPEQDPPFPGEEWKL